MADPLTLGVTSFLTVADADNLALKFFLHPAIASWNALTNVEASWQQSNLLNLATSRLNGYLRTLNLKGHKPENQVLEYPRDNVTPETIKEATLLQAMHLLTYMPLDNATLFNKSQKVGDLSQSVDTKGLQMYIQAISTEAIKLIADSDVLRPLSLKIRRA